MSCVGSFGTQHLIGMDVEEFTNKHFQEAYQYLCQLDEHTDIDKFVYQPGTLIDSGYESFLKVVLR